MTLNNNTTPSPFYYYAHLGAIDLYVESSKPLVAVKAIEKLQSTTAAAGPEQHHGQVHGRIARETNSSYSTRG